MQYDITIQGGEVLASLEERSITTLLVPFNEPSRTPKEGPGGFTVQAGSIALPADPSVVGLNTDHDRYAPVGRASRLWETAQGIMAAFTIARTPEGDAALADALNPQGRRRAVSAEFKTDIDDNRVARNGILAGAALVVAGAFKSARVLAELGENEISTYSSSDESIYTDWDGRKYRRVYESESSTEEVEGGTKTTTVTTSTETEVSDDTEGEPAVADQQETVQAGAVPGTLAPAAGGTAVLASRAPSMQEIAGAIAAVRANRKDQEAVEVLAALSDTVTSDAGAAIQPNWMGDIAAGVTYVQEYITLFNPGAEIYAGGKKGYKVHRGTSGAPLDAPMDGTWAGNKTAIKSNKGFVTEHNSVLDRWAMGEDIAREFWDLPGGMDFVLAFLRMQQEDYFIWQDDLALSYVVATAGAPIAPATTNYPANYPDALGHLIQGILAVKKRKKDGRRDTPTFAIANDRDYEELIYAAGGEQNLPAFVNIALSTSGNGTVDGNVQVVNGDIGIGDTGASLVGAGYAIDFDRPAGGLLEVDALDLARGGVDKAVHGYLQTFVKRPEALVLVGVADA
ncbi:hypothetical protein [Microbacterium sp. NPDC057650]|uniref:hypothetical protein n=1 Tax=unclassified Microbacterium TaxID=2609290 RepID=UPI00366BBDA3